MVIGGVLWVDARPAIGEVIAHIGGVECGRGESFLLADGGLPTLYVEVASAAGQPGCGTPGAPVLITVNGRAMNEAVEWRPGFQQPLTIIAGPAFAQYEGEIMFDASLIPLRVVPYVGGVPCGQQLNGFQGDRKVYYQVVVDPAELRPGCGAGGAQVTLRLEGALPDGTATEVVIDTVGWQAGPKVQRPPADVSNHVATTPASTPGAAE